MFQSLTEDAKSLSLDQVLNVPAFRVRTTLLRRQSVRLKTNAAKPISHLSALQSNLYSKQGDALLTLWSFYIFNTIFIIALLLSLLLSS